MIFVGVAYVLQWIRLALGAHSTMQHLQAPPQHFFEAVSAAAAVFLAVLLFFVHKIQQRAIDTSTSTAGDEEEQYSKNTEKAHSQVQAAQLQRFR